MTVRADRRILGCLMAAVGLLVTLLGTLHASANSVSPEFHCDFDDDMDPFCGLRQSTDDNFNWTRNNGSTPSANTGPQHDHTTGAGYYIFIEASGEGSEYKASLVSPSFISLNIPRCLRFAYHMYGRTVGRLQISSQNEVNVTGSNIIWTLKGNQGNQWHVVSQTVPAKTTRFVIEGVRGNGPFGDIAVDDITLTPGYCGTEFLCTFEDGICGFEFGLRDFNWTYHQGYTPNSGTGPTGDHTFADFTGHYMYLEASYKLPLSNASLISPVISNNVSSPCLVFFFHSRGRYVNSVLRVYLIRQVPGPVVFQKSGDFGNTWYEIRVPLPVGTNENYKLVFEAQRGTNFFGDLAIDDIMVVEGGCPNEDAKNITLPPETTSTTITTTTSTIPPTTSSVTTATATTATRSTTTTDSSTTAPITSATTPTTAISSITTLTHSTTTADSSATTSITTINGPTTATPSITTATFITNKTDFVTAASITTTSTPTTATPSVTTDTPRTTTTDSSTSKPVTSTATPITTATTKHTPSSTPTTVSVTSTTSRAIPTSEKHTTENIPETKTVGLSTDNPGKITPKVIKTSPPHITFVDDPTTHTNIPRTTKNNRPPTVTEETSDNFKITTELVLNTTLNTQTHAVPASSPSTTAPNPTTTKTTPLTPTTATVLENTIASETTKSPTNPTTKPATKSKISTTTKTHPVITTEIYSQHQRTPGSTLEVEASTKSEDNPEPKSSGNAVLAFMTENIASLAGGGGAFLLLLIIIITTAVICRRKRAKSHHGSSDDGLYTHLSRQCSADSSMPDEFKNPLYSGLSYDTRPFETSISSIEAPAQGEINEDESPHTIGIIANNAYGDGISYGSVSTFA